MTHETEPSIADLRERFVNAQLRGDSREALMLVEEGARTGLTVAEILVDIIQEAQYEVGRRWEDCQASVGEEHMATAIAQLAIALLQPMTMRPYRDLVVVGCVEGERHELGARIVANLLERDGYAICYVGCDLPTESLLEIVALRRPRVIALSVSLASNLAVARRAVTRLRARFGHEPVIVLGGQAVDALEPRAIVGAEVVAGGAPGAVAAIEELAEPRPHLGA
jgi:methanogenic corrinoid protein MtbC1